MSLKVNWSDRLEDLAEGLFDQWESAESRNPFSRVCIVVDDMATRNWLQHYFLFRRKGGKRKILANIEFKPLPEFVNDWLAAQVHGTDAAERRPSDHPYAKNVMAWRIDSILRRQDLDARLDVLKSYIGTDEKTMARRRFDLSSRLAQMYDDYLASRHSLLQEWAKGDFGEGDDTWQGVLYKLLVDQCGDTYAADYELALNPTADLEAAYASGFPRYEAVHVVDVAFAPEPSLEFLKRVADKLSVTFWNFSPAPKVWTADSEGGSLLETLASGAKGVLNWQTEQPGKGCGWLGGATPLAGFANLTIERHSCHSARRELEVLRSSLHEFFAKNKAARPSDALVLCANWAVYSPLVEAVFGAPGDDGYIPVALEGGVPVESPVKHAFEKLLDFKDNRFEVNAVFDLLGIPAVRRKFGIDADQLSVLRDLAKEANIHWGYDDDDVCGILSLDKEADAERPRPFTWRRGLDRLALDALLGEREDDQILVDAGAVGRLLPCGHVEGDRARAVGHLDAFVRRLDRLRGDLRGVRSCEGWRDLLLGVVEDFFEPDDDEIAEVSCLRMAVVSAGNDLKNAWRCANVEMNEVAGDVFVAAVLSGVRSALPHESAPGDAVLFAPLKNGTATPASFVWICGLNDGDFPRDGARPSFDLIGRSPTPFDVSARDKDLFAILKGAMGARMKLAFSYVGHNIRSNASLPASVALIDLMEWFRDSGIKVSEFVHPLQAYSPRYFIGGAEGGALPPNYSKDDHDAAENLVRQMRGEIVDKVEQVRAFAPKQEGETVIEFEDLESFVKRPNSFLLRSCMQTRTDDPGKEMLSDDEMLTTELSFGAKMMMRAEPTDSDSSIPAEVLVEKGAASSVEAVEKAVAREKEGEEYAAVRNRELPVGTADANAPAAPIKVVDAMKVARESAPEFFSVTSTCQGVLVRVVGKMQMMEVDGKRHVFTYEGYEPRGAVSVPDENAAILRHVAGHAAGLEFTSVVLTGTGKLKFLLPMTRDAAERQWQDIIQMVMDPLPPEYPDLQLDWKDDCLPPEMAERLAGSLEFQVEE